MGKWLQGELMAFERLSVNVQAYQAGDPVKQDSPTGTRLELDGVDAKLCPCVGDYVHQLVVLNPVSTGWLGS